MSIDITQFQQTFFEESLEGLDAMESALLELDVGAADNELINTIFRAAHSIKGGSATFGFENVAGFTHVLETLLDEMRDGRRDVTQEAVDLLLKSVDSLREMILALQSGDGDIIHADELQGQLETMLTGGEETVNTQATTEKAESSQHSGWEIYFKPHHHLFQTGNDPVRMFRELGSLGDSFEVQMDDSGLPVYEEFGPEESYLAWKVILKGDVSKEAVEEVFSWVEGDCDLTITPLATEVPEENKVTPSAENTMQQELAGESQPSAVPATSTATTKTGKPPAKKGGATESASIRVSIDKVDALINMVGELVITQSMLNQFGEDDEFDLSRIEKLRDGLAELERNTRELQESVMSIRMLPISFTFSRFPRMVHDLSQKLGKKVQLIMSGEQTELDKTVMEKIGDPLVHLVRNAVDHGIEKPEARIEANKKETGTIHLNAYHQGGNIVIEIKDDGAGINKQKLLKKAIERGLIREGEELTEAEIYDLIFMPGFSTAEVISDVSGRGVGMDVVKKNIIGLGGSIETESSPGEGTTLRIRLPLTLAILDGQTVKVGDEVYIIPLVSIMESIQVQENQVNIVGGEIEVFRLREEYLPIIRLKDVFDIETDAETLNDGLLVIVEGGGKHVGLFVDELLGQQQVVIKSLETNFKKVAGFSGATILGDGSVALILDIPGLIKISGMTRKTENIRAIA